MWVGTIIRTFVSRFLLLLVMIVAAPLFLIFILIPEKYRYNSRIAYFFVNLFYRVLIIISFLPIKYVGKKNIPKKPAIIVANHQSSLDIPLIGALMGPYPHIWLALADLMKSPILRWVLPWVSVLVDVSSPRRAVAALQNVVAVAEGKRCHILLFPEGGRYDDGEVHEFFRGFAILARETGRPVVPVRIFGLNKVYPRGSFWVKWYPVTVVVGQPMSLEPGEDDRTFKDRVREWFINQAPTLVPR